MMARGRRPKEGETYFNRSKTQAFNKVRASVGTLLDKKQTYLGYIGKCSANCPLFNDCDYERSKAAASQDNDAPCDFQKMFLNDMYISWACPYNGIGDIMTQQQAHLLGYMVMPLYSQLIVCEKTRMGIQEFVYADAKGTIKMHPVLREIREINKMILAALKETGLMATWEAKFGKNGKKPPALNVGKGKGMPDRFRLYEEQSSLEEEGNE